MEFCITVLGCGSALPVKGKHPSAQYLQIGNHHFLVDCGEGTQMQMEHFGIPKQKINHIFISHLHGDHFYGLIGLLTSYSLLNRLNPLHIFSPKGLKEIIYAHFDCNQTVFSYEIFFHEINTQNISTLLDDNDIEITSFPLLHSIPTVGFRFQEKDRDLNIRPEAIQKYNFDIETIKRIKKGDDVTLNDHTVIANSELTLAPFRKRSFAYCSDTAFFPEIVEHIREVDILYHEATFSHIDEENAKVAMHSTTTQAATIAKKASVKLLLIGHFSSRYFDFQSLLKEARSQFDDTILAEEGTVYRIDLERKSH